MTVAAEQARTSLDNPFAILGISREGIQGLTPEQAKQLAQTFYNQHARRLRPDSTGISEESLAEWRQIDDAWKSLRGPELVEASMKLYRPMPPEKEASIAERVVAKSKAEVQRTGKAMQRYIGSRTPVWTIGPADLHIVDLDKAFAFHTDNEVAVLQAALKKNTGLLGQFSKKISLDEHGVLHTENGSRRLCALLHLEDHHHDEPEDFFTRLRHAGLKRPNLKLLLPAASSDLEGQPQNTTDEATSSYTLHSISKEQFAHLGLYISAEAPADFSTTLCFLVTVEEESGLLHIDGLLLGIKK